MAKKLTPKQAVLRKRPGAICDRTAGGGWAIWMPSRRYDARISLVESTPRMAWVSALAEMRRIDSPAKTP
jgi:hypothetical protein